MTDLIDASTVLLLRDGGTPDAPAIETFMVRRHGKSRFMGGKYVFPGGKRDDADSTLALEPWCSGLTGARAAEILGDAEPARALGLFVAAVRETYEEANVLLGSGPDVDDAREALHHGSTDMITLSKTHGWRYDLGALRYFAHWITPPIEPRRFSARFFLARAPSDQEAIEDMREVTDGLWVSPEDAVTKYEAGDIDLPPPTLRVLQQLAGYQNVDDALAAAPHAPVEPCAPQLVRGDTVVLALVGDPLHPFEPGETVRRFTLEGRRWVADFPD